MAFFTAQFHKAMIFCQLIQPAFKIIYFIFFELCYQLFKNIDHTVFGIFRLFHVFEAYAINAAPYNADTILQAYQYFLLPCIAAQEPASLSADNIFFRNANAIKLFK